MKSGFKINEQAGDVGVLKNKGKAPAEADMVYDAE